MDEQAAPDITLQTLAEVGDFFGRRTRTAEGWHKAGMPGQEGAYSVRAIAQWMTDRCEAAAKGHLRDDEVSRIEAEIRAEDLQLKRLRRLKEQDALCRKDWVAEVAGAIGNILHESAERFERKFGPDGIELFGEILDRIEAEREKLQFGDDHDGIHSNGNGRIRSVAGDTARTPQRAKGKAKDPHRVRRAANRDP